MKTISTYWCAVKNFGDLITPELIVHYGARPVRSAPDAAEFVSVGSIMEKIPNNFSGYILGTGFKYEDSINRFINAKIVGVRGNLTKEKLKLDDNIVIGDPGLLLPKLYNTKHKKFKLGIIPHYVDSNNRAIAQIKNNETLNNINIINVKRHPEQVFHDISQCEHILSSSLHGLIVADSLSIPNAWIKLSDNVAGNGFKFFDHFSVSETIQKIPHILNGDERLIELLDLTYPVSKKILTIIETLDHKYSETINEIQNN